MKYWRRCWWLMGVMLMTTSTRVMAQADKPSEDVFTAKGNRVDAARAHFNRGVEHTKANQFAEALAEFQKAYDLSPTYKILYNIGQLSQHLGDRARGLHAFERYLADGGDQIDAIRRQEVETTIATLHQQVGTVRVQVNVDGAVVSMDDRQVGKAPLREPLYANPGRHRMMAQRSGKVTAEELIDVTPGKTIEATLTLDDVVDDLQRKRATLPPPVDSRATWPGWVATGTLAAGAIATGIFAVVSSNQLTQTRYAGPDRRPAENSEVSSLKSRVDGLAIATDVLAGAALLSLGITLYVTLTQPTSHSSRSATRKTSKFYVGERGAIVGGLF